MSLDGLSMRRLVKELDAEISGGRIDRISQPGKNLVQLFIRRPGKNLILGLFAGGENPCARILDAAIENPAEPPAFCMLLRKRLESGKISGIYQHSLDRVIVIDMDFLAPAGRIVTKSLVIEMMGKYSNVILTEDGVIIDALKRVGPSRSRLRLVLPGQKYEFPPDGGRIDPVSSGAGNAVRRLRGGTGPLSREMSRLFLGIGPVTAKEVAFSAGLSPDVEIESLDDADFAAIEEAMRETFSAASDASAPAYLAADSNGKLLAAAAFPLHYIREAEEETFSDMRSLLARADAVIGGYVPPDRDRFARVVKNELVRARNKIEKLKAEEDEAENADEYRVKADNLMAARYRLRDRADAEVTLTDIYSEDGAQIKISLDQRLTVSENIQRYYKKYGKLKRARAIISGQIEEARGNIRYLEGVAASLRTSSAPSEMNDIRTELIAGGYLREKAKRHPGERESEPLSITAPDGTVILVGKNNVQNDRLTFKIANGGDMWLHAKDIPGSHVIVRTDGRPVSRETLIFAAEIAARFSQASDSSKVPVDYVPCRHVRKPSGARPGFVVFTGQKTIYVTPEPK